MIYDIMHNNNNNNSNNIIIISSSSSSNKQDNNNDTDHSKSCLRSVFRISCLFLRPRLWQSDI